MSQKSPRKLTSLSSRCYGRRMIRRRDRRAIGRRALGLVLAVAAAAGCASGSRTERESETAALRRQLEEMRRSQDETSKELARLAGQVKALDAQSAYLVGAARGAREDLARMETALGENSRVVRDLSATVSEMGKPVFIPPASTPAALRPLPAPTASPEALYTAALASFQSDEHGQAVLEFGELRKRFPDHPLAANAQYWIGEAYYRQRDFRQAQVEFQKVVDVYPKSAQVAEALLKIGLSYRALKDPGRARHAWEQVVKEYPSTSAATQARALLAAPAAPAATR